MQHSRNHEKEENHNSRSYSIFTSVLDRFIKTGGGFVMYNQNPRDVSSSEILEAFRGTRSMIVAARCIRLLMLNAMAYAEVHTYVIMHVMTKCSRGSYVIPI